MKCSSDDIKAVGTIFFSAKSVIGLWAQQFYHPCSTPWQIILQNGFVPWGMTFFVIVLGGKKLLAKSWCPCQRYIPLFLYAYMHYALCCIVLEALCVIWPFNTWKSVSLLWERSLTTIFEWCRMIQSLQGNNKTLYLEEKLQNSLFSDRNRV